MSDNIDTLSVTLQEYRPQLVTCLNCSCGLCVYRCPAYVEVTNEAVTARGLSHICLAVADGELDISEIPDEILYACTGCRWCEWTCSFNTPLYIQKYGTRKTEVSGATMTEILRSMKIEAGGQIPEPIKDALNNTARAGNPYGKPKATKDNWFESLGCKFEGTGSLLYVGSTVPYEERATRMAEALIEVFKKAGLNFFVLGGNESDSGSLARYTGEEGLLEELVEQNSKLFREKKVKEIICLSPHDYDTFRSCYGLENVEIKHYTETLLELIKDKKITFGKNLNKSVTYQDPCYLGRRWDIYDQPREILTSIPGLQLVEMDRTRGEAACCGGGGTGIWYDVPGININDTRVEQANEKSPDYLAVACPICLQMLDDGVKSRDYSISVKDISQIVLEAL